MTGARGPGPADDDAIYAFRRNVVVAASAGTGKTFRLTALYLLTLLGLTSRGAEDPRLAAPPIPAERIVATTFSRAAALEIRVRVEDALRALAEGRPTAYARVIEARRAALDDAPDEAELAARARDALARAGEIRIDTLHGLASALLRKHALDLGLSPGFEVATEEDSLELAFAVIDEALAEALQGDEDAQEAVRTLTRACGGFFRARQEIFDLFTRLDDDGRSVRALRPGDHEAAGRALHAELVACLRGCASGARPTLAGPASAALLALSGDDPGSLSLGSAAKLALGELFAVRKPSKNLTPEEVRLYELRDTLGGTNAERPQRLAATLEAAALLERRERDLLGLLARIEARLRRERERRGALGFGDLLRVLRDGLSADPRTQRLVGEGIDVLMVDEFQDTNGIQRDLVYLLWERPDASRARAPGAAPRADDLRGAGLFVVGDRKQSIYAFRGADVEVFNQVAAELAGEPACTALALDVARASPRPSADFVTLQRSYRSGPAIVGFVNAFSKADFLGQYGPGEELVAGGEAAGDAVEIVADDASPIDDPLLAGGSPALREAFAAAAAAATAIADGASARDVAVLARRRRTIPLVELALERLGVPYVVAGRALYDTSEVRDLAALLGLVVEPRDRLALTHVLRSPIVGLSDDALLALCEGRRGLARGVVDDDDVRLDAAAFAEDAPRLAAFVRRFREARPGLLRMAAAEATLAAVSAFGLDELIALSPRAPARLGNVDRVVAIARERGGSLFSFWRWLDRQIRLEEDEAEAVVFSPEDDAVRLTTIHAAKGLDFPVTILVDLNVKEVARHPILGFHEDRLAVRHKGDRGVALESPALVSASRAARARARAERARISYVAVTRAERRLVLIAPPGEPQEETALATLRGLPDVVPRDGAALVRDALGRGLHAPPAPEPPRSARAPGSARLPLLPEQLTIAATPLGVFQGCPRRFRLRFLLGLEEPIDTGQLLLFEVDTARLERKVEPFDREGDGGDAPDPRARGRAAHRVLELVAPERFGRDVPPHELAAALAREGLEGESAARLAADLSRFLASPFAAALGAADELRREEEVVLRMAAIEAPRTPALTLRGTVDLWARRGDAIDVIDYKLARPPHVATSAGVGPASTSLGAYAFQLRAYALALASARPGHAVRAGLVFLEAPNDPWFLPGADGGERLTAEDHARFSAELAELTRRLAEARARAEWPGVPVASCRALGCGFITACHRGSDGPKRKGRR